MNTEQPLENSWFKSSYSGDEGGECVEVAADLAAVLIRDSKEHAGPRLAFTQGAWSRFVTGLGRDRT
jgi:hypothetical protein